jgi:hypothetical protein
VLFRWVSEILLQLNIANDPRAGAMQSAGLIETVIG